VNEQEAAALRKPFDRKHIDQIPKRSKNGGTIYLDYVGHAHVTDRLLQVDPEWNWMFASTDDNGNPVIDEFGGIWIFLTVCGVTRIGYGWADGEVGGNAIKEAIGDAIRNASMRFGVALDLWMKEPASPPATTKSGTKKATEAKPVTKVKESPADPTEQLDRAYLLVSEAGNADTLKALWQHYSEHLDTEFNGTTLRNYILQRKAEMDDA